MPCRHIGNMIVCSRGPQKRERCDTPGCTGFCVALCDFPVIRNGQAGTCDVKMCRFHRNPALDKKDTDYCVNHCHQPEVTP
jgi:hypothetical protein